MKVSIITATYNSESTIKSCIRSVNMQTYPNIEHIFIDGLSSDGTINTIKTLSSRENTIISEPDKGIYDALNKGILRANGQIIGLVHSDDILASKTIIEEIVASFKNNQVDGVYGDLLYVRKENLKRNVRKWKGKNYHKNLIFKGWMPAHPTLFLKKEVYQEHGLFDISFAIASDYNFMLKILLDKSLNFYYLPKFISKMRVGGESNKTLKNIILKSKEDFRVLKNHGVRNPFLVLLRKNSSKLTQFLTK